MNYLLYGTDKFLISKEVDNIKKKEKISELNISKYDLLNNSIKNILEDANTLSLFDDKKLIIVNNSNIFTKTKDKISDIDLLEEYLLNYNINTIIVFICPNEKVDGIKKITKYIKEKGIVKEIKTEKNIVKLVIPFFENYKISNENINFLIDRVGNNLEILFNEIEKIKIYKGENRVITKEDIINITSENVSTDIFKFIDSIINKDKTKALKSYNNLIKLNEEPIKIVALLASKFRLIYQVKQLSKKGHTEDEIANILNSHKYPVHLALVTGYNYDSKLLLKYLNDLADLDIGMKTGEKDIINGLELFILSL